MSETGKATAGIIFVNVMWGLSFIASKFALQSGFSSFSLAFARFVLATVLLFPALWKKEGFRPFPKKGFTELFLSGLFANTVYFFCEYEGLNRLSASTASLIISAIPVFSMLTSVLLHKKRYKRICWLGGAVAMVGIYLLVAAGKKQGGSAAGYLLLLGACLSWLVYIECTDRLLAKHCYSSLEVTCWQSLIGTVTLLPLMLLAGPSMPWGPGWISVLFLGTVCSALCYLLYARSIAVLGPVQSSLYININPIASVVGGILLLHEQPHLIEFLGGAIVLISIFVVTRGMNRSEKEPQ